ncbi:MAG: amidotransferase [Bacteroidetes bacterium GWF2_41_31]|nr:MAG: amidotransferase [Bacteroidetes bacterium GWF2_41_31]OFZ07271.1 MAG: amidotransferase [Bacteroidetes bacterium RIFOXYB12_FULL_41_6]
MTIMRVHYLQHVFFEGLGFIEPWLKENKHSITSTKFFEDSYTIPNIEDIDALIVMGGEMGVYDDNKYSWLNEEKIFIGTCISAGKKVLGICLGAQLMAVCLGANIFTAKNKEIGWFCVSPTKECKKVPWIYDLFKDKPIVFHWHGDKFEIPYNRSFSFLSSDANDNQAFYYSKNVIGLQFHLEVTEETMELMLQNAGHELQELNYIQAERKIKNGLENIETCNKIMGKILTNWLE